MLMAEANPMRPVDCLKQALLVAPLQQEVARHVTCWQDTNLCGMTGTKGCNFVDNIIFCLFEGILECDIALHHLRETVSGQRHIKPDI